jgi:hypothetical protein
MLTTSYLSQTFLLQDNSTDPQVLQGCYREGAYPPRWFSDLAEEQKVNFSAPLQKALKDYLGISEAERAR